MKDKYNLLELTFNQDIEKALILLQEYFKMNNISEVRFKEDTYTYTGNDKKLDGKYLWRFYNDDKKIYIISYLEENDEIYAHYYKMYSTDYSGIDYDHLNILDRSKITVKSFEHLVDFFKSNGFDVSFNEKLLDAKDALIFGWDKKIIVFQNEKDFLKTERKVTNRYLRFLLDMSFIIELGILKYIKLCNLFIIPIILYFLIIDFRNNNNHFVYIKNTILIILNTSILLITLFSYL